MYVGVVWTNFVSCGRIKDDEIGDEDEDKEEEMKGDDQIKVMMMEKEKGKVSY